MAQRRSRDTPPPRRPVKVNAKDILEIRGWVGADDEDVLAAIGQGDGCRASRRRLADAALARKEKIWRLRCVVRLVKTGLHKNRPFFSSSRTSRSSTNQGIWQVRIL